MDLSHLTTTELAAGIRSGDFSASELTRATLDRIERLDPTVCAFLNVYADEALARAGKVDEALASGESVGPLAGVPVAVKDNMCTQFGTTTCASKILSEYRAPYDATVVDRLTDAGAVIVGKTNLDEFAMGSSTENSAFRKTVNPWDVERVPGGSSGGSGAAVSARLVSASLGSDTGGSIRLPAAFCGVTGMKPTYGRVSRYGLVAYGSSLDQVGPFAVDARDVGLMLNVIAGHDDRDSTSVSDDYAGTVDFLAGIDDGVKGLRIGLPREYFSQGGLDRQTQGAVDAALTTLKELGAEPVEISLPHTEYAVACYYLIATAEASSNLARYDGVHYGYRTAEPSDYIDVYSSSRAEGFGDEVIRRIMLGTYVLSAGYYEAYYLKALKVRTLIRRDFEQAFKDVDVICSPVSPTPAFRIGEKSDDPLTMYLTDIFTISANLAGIPAISVPCGFTDGTLPVALQILGKHFDEATLLRTANAYQQATDWHRRVPPIADDSEA